MEIIKIIKAVKNMKSYKKAQQVRLGDLDRRTIEITLNNNRNNNEY